MCGSTTLFGQYSFSPFCSPSVFGASSSNSFAQFGFGNSDQFGLQTASSTPGITTGVFSKPSSTLVICSYATSPLGNPSSNLNSKSSPVGSAGVLGSQTSTGATFGTRTGTFCVLPPGATALESSAHLFGSSSPALAFGQYSFRPFGSSSVFGANSASSFAQSVFGNSKSSIVGSASTFGSQTSTPSIFGTRTGTFCALPPCTSAFKSPAPLFGASSLPTPCSSLFGQQPTTGAFWSNSNQSNPFGRSNAFSLQTTSSTFGTSSGIFGNPSSACSSCPFGSSRFIGSTFGTPTGSFFGQPSGITAFGSSAPSFGVSTRPAFGFFTFGQQTTTGPFGSNSNQSSPFGSSNSFGSSTAFGATSSPSFGQSSNPAFGSASSSPAFFGSTSPAAFCSQSNSPAFGSVSSTSSFGFGNSTSAFGCTSFGKAQPSALGTQSTQFSTQTKMRGFGQTGSDNQQGSRVISYASVQEGSEKFMSISFMPPYKDKKSHEELRWEDYQLGDKGGAQVQTQAIPFGQPATTANSFGSTNTSTPFSQPASASPFGSTNNSQPAANTSAFGSTTANNPFSRPAAANARPFGSTNTRNTFSQPAANTSAFGSTNTSNASDQPAANTSAFGSTDTSNAFSQPAANTSAFGSANTSNASFGRSAAISSAFGSTNTSNAFVQPAANTSAFGSANTSNAFGQPAAISSAFGSTNTSNVFGQPAANASPFGSANTSSQFNQPAANSSSLETTNTSSPFGQTATNANPFGLRGTGSQSGQQTSATSSFSLFGQPATTAPNLFGSSNTSSSFGQPASSNLFGTTNTASSSFGQSSATNPSFNSQSAAFGIGSSSAPSFGSNSAPAGFSRITPSLFGSTPSAVGTNASSGSTSAFTTNSQSSSIFAQSTGQNLFNGNSSSLFSTTSNTGFGQATTTPSVSAPFQQSAPAQTSNAFAFSNFGQTHSDTATQSTTSMHSSPQPNAVMQMPMPNFSTVSSIQQGIANMPVCEKPVPIKFSPLLNPRHLSRGRIKLPARKYYPKGESKRVPFFDGEQTDRAPYKKTDVMFTPRANPRLIMNPTERRHSGSDAENQPVSNSIHCNGNGIQTENGRVKQVNDTNLLLSTIASENGHVKLLNVYESDMEALLPKLRTADYYTEPQIEELAEIAAEEPEYCRHVKDFVVGRRGFGYIKFYGETDVRGLDLESIIEFNNREVVVYKDGSNKPGIGQGLNKPAEVSLLNIKCINRNSGKAYTTGPKVEKLTQLLKTKAEEQKADFLSYDAVVGEWKFRVKHF